MWEQLRRFSNLPARARVLFLRAATLLPWVALRLKMQGFQATRKFLQKSIEESSLISFSGPGKITERAALTARMVRAAARHGLGSPSCLEESLVLVHLLRRQGITAQLRIGIKKNVPQFEAHSWVESNGVALNESEALHDHYAPFEAEFSENPPAQS
jgi:hypothetical protein